MDSGQIDRLLDFPALCEALRQAFLGSIFAPPRHHHAIGNASLLLMPAWTIGEPTKPAFLGTKIVSVFPNNGALRLPALAGLYVLQSGETGMPLAVMDGGQLTLWRTAATSALAARFLATPTAENLTMVGAGALAPFLIRAHASVRALRRVQIWNHNSERAVQLASQFMDAPFKVSVAQTLEEACSDADIICCATLSKTPLVKGEWLKAGAHLDLVGAFAPDMREVDDQALRHASIFIDTSAACTEGGDIAIAIQNGIIMRSDIKADLASLCLGQHLGRANGQEVTLFKSIGTAIEDLAAASLVWQRMALDAKMVDAGYKS